MGVPETMGGHDERISEDRYGCYTVLFSNVNGLETEEICYTFAEFGRYLSIRKAGNQCGIHFVTYETYEEAKRAVDGLEDHPDIQLKVYRKKRRNYFNDGNNNNNNRWPNGGYANDAGQRMNRWRSTNRQFNDHNYAREECAENGNRRNTRKWAESSAWNGTSDRDVSDDKLTKKLLNGNGASDYCKTSEFTEDEKSPDYTWVNEQNYLASFNSTRETDQTESIETIAAKINTEDEQFVKFQEDEDAESIDMTKDDKESASSTTAQEEEKEDSTSIIQEVVYAKASEVIVGNVDLRLNEAYLLHLFDKYEPIAVSQLVPLPRGNVGYCYIYFKNEDVTLKVERNFDKLCLHGRQIVVQRPRRLIAAYLDQL